MIHYLATVATHIKTVDDINLSFYMYRSLNGKIEDKGDKFSILRNIDSLYNLTDKNLRYITAGVILTTEIAYGNKTYSEGSKINLYGMVYDTGDDRLLIRICKAESKEEATVVLEDSIKDIKDAKSNVVFKLGVVVDSEYIEDAMKNEYIISIEEKRHPSIMIVDRLDSMSEYNRKMMDCSLQHKPL